MDRRIETGVWSNVKRQVEGGSEGRPGGSKGPGVTAVMSPIFYLMR